MEAVLPIATIFTLRQMMPRKAVKITLPQAPVRSPAGGWPQAICQKIFKEKYIWALRVLLFLLGCVPWLYGLIFEDISSKFTRETARAIFVRSQRMDKRGVMPHRIHQLWIGGPISDECKESSATWQHFAKVFDWEYKLWFDDDISALPMRNREWMYGSKGIDLSNQMHSDVARFEILWFRGGVYIDCDMRWLGVDGFRGEPKDHQPTIDFIDTLDRVQVFAAPPHWTGDFWQSTIPKIYFATGVIAAPPMSPILDTIIRQLPMHVQNALNHGVTDSYMQAGPELLNKAIGTCPLPITILPSIWIFPHNPSDPKWPDKEMMSKRGVLWGHFKPHVRRIHAEEASGGSEEKSGKRHKHRKHKHRTGNIRKHRKHRINPHPPLPPETIQLLLRNTEEKNSEIFHNVPNYASDKFGAFFSKHHDMSE